MIRFGSPAATVVNWWSMSSPLPAGDTLMMAREMHPGQKNSLDALCSRYAVDHSRRTLHGALLDAQLLAEAYLALTAGQGEIALEAALEATGPALGAGFSFASDGARPRVLVMAGEREAHEARLAQLRRKAGAAVWDRLDEIGGEGVEAAEAALA